MTHIPWPPAHLSHAKFHQLAGKITLPRLGAAIIQANRTPLEEMTVTDFRNLTQPHDLRSQLGLAMSPDPLEGSTCTVNVHANEPSRLGDKIARMVGERTAGYKNPEVVITVNPDRMSAEQAARIAMNLKSTGEVRFAALHPGQIDARAIQRLVPAGKILIKGKSVDDFLAGQPEGAAPVTESDITAIGEMTPDLASVLRGIQLHTGGPINLPGVNSKADMKHRLDTLDEETLSLLVDVGNRAGRDRRRVDAARTQFELAFMMLKRAIEEA